MTKEEQKEHIADKNQTSKGASDLVEVYIK